MSAQLSASWERARNYPHDDVACSLRFSCFVCLDWMHLVDRAALDLFMARHCPA